MLTGQEISLSLEASGVEVQSPWLLAAAVHQLLRQSTYSSSLVTRCVLSVGYNRRDAAAKLIDMWIILLVKTEHGCC